MLSVYHVPTAYLIASLVFLALPTLTWMTLRSERSIAANWWAAGGLLISAGLMALGLRQAYPQLLPFNTGFTLVMMGLATQLHVLALQLNQTRQWPKYMAVFLAGAALKELLYRWNPDSVAHYLLAYTLLTAALLMFGFKARQIALNEDLASARWLSRSNLLAAAAFGVRTLTGLVALSEPEALNNQASGILTTLVVVAVALMNNFAIIGIYLERSQQRNARLRLEEERARAAAELTAQVAQMDRQRSMGELAAGLAHELGQPITGILMDASSLKQALEAGNTPAAEQLEMAQAIIDQASRSRHILEGIRNFIRPSAQSLAPLNLSEVIAGTRTMLAPALRSSRAELRLHCNSPWPWVNGDVVQLSQVFLNLLRNALQAQRPQVTPVIEISLCDVGDMLEVVMEDNGLGMNEAQLARSATAFHTTKPEGMGVGLAISTRIMQHHGGTLTLSHAASGQGLRATLRLPRCKSPAPQTHLRRRPASTGGSSMGGLRPEESRPSG